MGSTDPAHGIVHITFSMAIRRDAAGVPRLPSHTPSFASGPQSRPAAKLERAPTMMVALIDVSAAMATIADIAAAPHGPKAALSRSAAIASDWRMPSMPRSYQ